MRIDGPEAKKREKARRLPGENHKVDLPEVLW